VLDADRRGRLGRHVDLAEALALEPGGEGEQLRVVPLGQRRDGRRVDAAGQERADRDVGAHVLLDGVLERLGDLAVELLGLGHRFDGEVGVEVTLRAHLLAGPQRE